MKQMGYDKYMMSIDKRLSKQDKLTVLDGATGTEIYRRGVLSYDVPWALGGLVYNPQILRQIHYDYFTQGAHVVTANCFYTTGMALRNTRLAGMEKSLTFLGVLLAQQAEIQAHQKGITQETCVAGNVAPLETENPYDPTTAPLRSIAITEHRIKIQNLIEAGADFILIETMPTLYEAEAALEASSQVSPKPIIWMSFSCDETGTLWGGETMKEVADLVESYSPKAVLINCTPIEGVTRALRELSRNNLSMPLGGYANVEKQVYEGSMTWDRIEDLTSKDYAEKCKEWWELGARIIGGCCGTTPEDIGEVVRAFEDKI